MLEALPAARGPRRLRQANETAALRALHQSRRLSRADLARELRLNRSSSGHIVAALIAEGLAREVDEAGEGAPRRAGRPGILVELVPEALCFVGLEIGVEHIGVVELDLAARLVREAQEPFDGRAASVDAAVARALDMAFGAMRPERRAACEGIGLATPSQMGRDGVVRVAPLLGWADVDLGDTLRRLSPLMVPTMVENDANALAIGATYGRTEARAGVTLVLNLESGVGGGLLIDGHLVRGAHGLAGEIGHLRMGASGPEAAVTLEERLGLERVLAGHRARSGLPDARLADFLGAVRDREPEAVGLAEAWARALAFAIAQACRVIDAGAVVLGGSMAALFPLVAARVEAHLRGFQEASFPLPAILVHDDAEFGAAFGAACMLHQRFLSAEARRPAEATPD